MNGTFCGHCTQQMVVREPGALGKYHIDWTTILERHVPFTCPACGPVYFVANIVKMSPSVPAPIRELATGVCYGLLIFTAGRVVGEFIGWLGEA